MDQYPRWKYGTSGEAKIVQDADEEEALGEGWYDSPADVPDPQEESEDDQPKRDALMAEAEALGIAIDGRWGDKRLADEIAKAKAGA